MSDLTRRETEVLALIGQGLAVPEIAQHLHRSVRTIQAHRYSLGRKLGVRNSVALARIAVETGLAPVDNITDHVQADLRREIAERTRAQAALSAIETGTATVTGEDFSRSLVRHLSSALGMKAALIAVSLDESSTLFRTIAFWVDDDLRDNVELSATDCAFLALSGTELQSIPSGVRERYPDCPLLRRLDAESYLGTLLHDSIGSPLGVLAVFHDGPTDETLYPELILRVFAARAGAELERMQAEHALQLAHDELEERIVERTAELRESEERFSKAFHASPIAISISDLETGKCIALNDSYLKMFRYERDEIIGRSALDLHTWADPKDRTRVVATLRKHGRIRGIEACYRTKSGRIGTARLSADVIDLHGRPCLLAFAEDITAHHQAEETLRARREQIERLAMQAPAMIWTVDHDLRITESVGSALEQIGLIPGQTVGLTLQEHFKTDDPNFPSIAAHRRALQGEKVTYSREMNGRTYQSRVTPLLDDQSRIIGAVGISFDITGAKPSSA